MPGAFCAMSANGRKRSFGLRAWSIHFALTERKRASHTV